MSTEAAKPKSPLGKWGPLLAILIVAIVLGMWFVSAGNHLVVLQENVHTAWAQVETVLERRFDLIPNLVETVKGYAEHEKEILEEVTRLRSQWGQAKTVDEKAKAGSALDSALSRLLVVSENYPDLKANQNFRDLQVELSGTENRISVERQRYNEVVRDLQHGRPPVPDQHRGQPARVLHRFGLLRGGADGQGSAQGGFLQAQRLTDHCLTS